MRILTRSHLIYTLALGLIIGLGVGVISVMGTDTGWIPGPIATLIFGFFSLRKSLRRWRATRRPLKDRTTTWLRKNIPVYPRLAPEARDRFNSDVQIVLDEWLFEGVGDVQVTDEMRLGVAAGAALLLHGHPYWELPYRQSVLFYSDYFDDEYLVESEGDFEGMAHQQGPLIFTVKALDRSWKNPEDGANVVLHELAHLLDYETAFADGVPSLVDERSTVAWEALVRKEMDRIKRRQSILRGYGATEPAEFFAVAVESFFEQADLMEERHPELFIALAALFNLDPRTGLPTGASPGQPGG